MGGMVEWLKGLWKRFFGKPDLPAVPEEEKRPDTIVVCTHCNADYTDALRFIPASSCQATLICSNAECQQQMELYPHARWGWLVPEVIERDRIYK